MLDLTSYLQWRNTEFGMEHISQNRPAYMTPQVKLVELPPIKEVKSATTPNSRVINTTELRQQTIEQDTFDVVTDSFDREITDAELLVKLKVERSRLAMVFSRPLYAIAHNATLVEIATIKPTTKQEYLSIKNIGEKSYEAYGRDFISVVLEHIEG